MATSTRRRSIAIAAIVIVLGPALYWTLRFPPDTTPKGAYMRIAAALAQNDARACFAYLEEDAQHASFTIFDYSKKARLRIADSYPEAERERALAPYAPLAGAKDGPDTWVRLAEQRGWLVQLRRDLSGAEAVEVAGERATVTTARGSRYSFRRRPNGIWGLTLFTAELMADAQRLARDWELIQKAAGDYRRGGTQTKMPR